MTERVLCPDCKTPVDAVVRLPVMLEDNSKLVVVTSDWGKPLHQFAEMECPICHKFCGHIFEDRR